MTDQVLYQQRDQPDGVPPLSLTGERTLPDVPEENYWYRRHLAVYEWIAQRVHGRRVGILHVLDRLEEHHAVDVPGPGLDHVPLEGHPVRRVLQARVFERLGVRVDPDDRARGGAEQGRAVPLAAGQVDHAPPVRPRGDPLVDREVAAEPVVLLRHVRQRALAGERERWHAVGLIALEVELRHRRRRP